MFDMQDFCNFFALRQQHTVLVRDAPQNHDENHVHNDRRDQRAEADDGIRIREAPQQRSGKERRRAAAELTGTHDFRAFSSIKRGKKSTVRTIESIDIDQDGSAITLSFTGNGFLYHMVRILTGTLVEVGLHEKTPENMKTILASLNREQAGVMAPAQGLFLVEVEYQ